MAELLVEQPQRETQRDEGLECPRCGCRHFKVSRTVPQPRQIRRERVCRHCGRIIVTYERIAGQ